MSPQEAYQRLVDSGEAGFDDPYSSHYPVRWYWDERGILSRCGWRNACPTHYPEFQKPKEQDQP